MPVVAAKITRLKVIMLVKNIFVFIFIDFIPGGLVFGLLILVCINDGERFKKLQNDKVFSKSDSMNCF